MHYSILHEITKNSLSLNVLNKTVPTPVDVVVFKFMLLILHSKFMLADNQG